MHDWEGQVVAGCNVQGPAAASLLWITFTQRGKEGCCLLLSLPAPHRFPPLPRPECLPGPLAAAHRPPPGSPHKPLLTQTKKHPSSPLPRVLALTSACSWSATAWPAATLREHSTTSAPACASARTVSTPMPLFPPIKRRAGQVKAVPWEHAWGRSRQWQDTSLRTPRYAQRWRLRASVAVAGGRWFKQRIRRRPPQSLHLSRPRSAQSGLPLGAPPARWCGSPAACLHPC